jgi:hypothetical protein
VTDIFISYKSEDRAAAQVFADALVAEGVSVWWDPVLRTGETYDEVIERNLREAALVLVLWSPRSVKSKWVRAEATIGERKAGLMPVLIEPCERPIAFELVQTADLCGWAGDRGDARWLDFMGDLRNALTKHQAQMRAHTAPPPPDALTIETLFWSSIKDGNDPADFEAYLQRYPHGQFVDLARNRTHALRARPKETEAKNETQTLERDAVEISASAAESRALPRLPAQPPGKRPHWLLPAVAGGVAAVAIAGVVFVAPMLGGPSDHADGTQIVDPTSASTPPVAQPGDGATSTPAESAALPPQQTSPADDPVQQVSAPVEDTAAAQRRVLEHSLRAALVGYVWYGGFTNGRPNDGSGNQGYWEFAQDGAVCHSISVDTTCGTWSVSGSTLTMRLPDDGGSIIAAMRPEWIETSSSAARRVVLQREDPRTGSRFD